MVTDGLTYLCMTDQEFSRPVAFQFLSDVKDRFQSQTTRRQQQPQPQSQRTNTRASDTKMHRGWRHANI